MLREGCIYTPATCGTVWAITVIDNGDTIDCTGWDAPVISIPSLRAELIQFKAAQADFILHVEKDNRLAALAEDKFWKEAQMHRHARRGPVSPPRGQRAAAFACTNEPQTAGLRPAG